MNQEQEIRAKALEIAVQTLALMPQDARKQYLDSHNKGIQENVIRAAEIYEKHIRGK